MSSGVPTVEIRTDHGATRLRRRNGLLKRKHSCRQRADSLCIELQRRRRRRAGKGQLDGKAVTRDAGCFKGGRVRAALADDGFSIVDVAKGDLHQDAAG